MAFYKKKVAMKYSKVDVADDVASAAVNMKRTSADGGHKLQN